MAERSPNQPGANSSHVGCPELCAVAGINASLSGLPEAFMRGCSRNFDIAYSCRSCKGQKYMCGGPVQIIFLSY